MSFIATSARVAHAAPAAAAKDAPKNTPKDTPKDPADRPAGETRSLAGGTIHYTAPDGWVEATKAAKDDTAAFAWPDHGAALAVQVLPTDAKTSPAAAAKIVQFLRNSHLAKKQPIVLAPTVEKDPRFALRIHEKFKNGDKTTDQLHLYRQVGPRVVMVTVNTTTDADAENDDVKTASKVGEDVAVSATFAKKGE